MIYVIHFDAPLSRDERSASNHYVGYVNDGGREALARRLELHARGRGAVIMRALKERGIGWRLAAVYTGTRHDERRIKNQGNAHRFCPVCRANEPIGKPRTWAKNLLSLMIAVDLDYESIRKFTLKEKSDEQD